MSESDQPRNGHASLPLGRAPRGFRLMQDEAALSLVVEDLFEQLAADGVIYSEIRFAPLLHLERGLKPAEVVAAVDRATEACIRSSGIEARLILLRGGLVDRNHSRSAADGFASTTRILFARLEASP